jgi:hypothetical protein
VSGGWLWLGLVVPPLLQLIFAIIIFAVLAAIFLMILKDFVKFIVGPAILAVVCIAIALAVPFGPGVKKAGPQFYLRTAGAGRFCSTHQRTSQGRKQTVSEIQCY